jgi:hypothetical protein
VEKREQREHEHTGVLLLLLNWFAASPFNWICTCSTLVQGDVSPTTYYYYYYYYKAIPAILPTTRPYWSYISALCQRTGQYKRHERGRKQELTRLY